MPDFWEFPTVSMGLSPLMAIYQARFNRYLEDRGLKPATDAKVWAFLGDGETDEPESLGAITLASRENLDNLIFVINCNLQRLDGPVRGNGQIIQELEAAFRGAGWNVIKVLWGSDWDPLLERDTEGLLVKRMGEMVDGEYQKLVVSSGAYVREHFFGTDPRLLKMVETVPDEELRRLRLGGHDPRKVYAAYKAAVEHKGSPTVILARTIKGYGLGEAGEGKNITHQQKKLNEEELREFRTRFDIPLNDEQLRGSAVLPPAGRQPRDSIPARAARGAGRIRAAAQACARSRWWRTTTSCSRNSRPAAKAAKFPRRWRSSGCCGKCCAIRKSASWWCPSCRMKRAPSAWSRCSAGRNLFEQPGQLLRAGGRATRCSITRKRRTGRFWRKASPKRDRWRRSSPPARPMRRTESTRFPSSFTIRCSDSSASAILSGPRRTCACADSCWAARRAARRLPGEGLQHQDGNSHVLALPVPNLRAYDPAFAYEIAVIIRGRHPPHVQGRRKHLLLHHGDERALRDAADAAETCAKEF